MTAEEEIYLVGAATDLLLGGADLSNRESGESRRVDERITNLVRASVSSPRFQVLAQNWGLEVLRPLPPGGFQEHLADIETSTAFNTTSVLPSQLVGTSTRRISVSVSLSAAAHGGAKWISSPFPRLRLTYAAASLPQNRTSRMCFASSDHTSAGVSAVGLDPVVRQQAFILPAELLLSESFIQNDLEEATNFIAGGFISQFLERVAIDDADPAESIAVVNGAAAAPVVAGADNDLIEAFRALLRNEAVDADIIVDQSP